ncbi:MAG: efflux RND transporter permease subunit [Spirochaetaceae bacterium]|nr:efflux RND transporter permease subunit [Spirochaetaceae bacterium]
MSIAKRVVNRPTTFLILYSLIVGLALYIVPQVPIDLFPEISPPILVVFTDYPGAGPEEVEQTVTRPMEGALTNVSGVKAINSTSAEGTSTIILELSWGLDLSEATNEVRDKLEFVKDFMPADAGTPQIFKFDPSLIPIFQMSVEGNRSPDELFAIAEDQIQPRLEQVDGVALVTLSGGRDRAIRVEVSQNRLEAYGLTLTQVTQVLAAQNIQIGSGSVYEGNFKYLVETQGQFDSIEDIRNAVITYKGGGVNPLTGASTGSSQPIRLRDFAEVTDSYKDATNATYVNGDPGIYISMQKQSGTNSVEVSDNIIAKLDEIRDILPADVSLTVIYDTTKIIRQSLQGVTSSAILGAVLAMVVLFFFLRSFKSTIIIGLSIPISLLVTIMVMYFSGLTLNIMTLAGLTLGIGMIVDSSIVILENIFRYREKGAKAGPAAHLGAQEMITAITASILTTVGIFLPLLLFKKELDIIGVLFQDLALTIVIALLASLVIAVSLVPVLSSKYLTLFTRKQRPIKNRLIAGIDTRMENGFTKMDNGYKRLLARVLDHKGLTAVIMVLILVVSIFTLEPLGGNIGIELAPNQAQDVVQISMELPIGTRYEVTEDALMQLADIARREIQGYQDIFILAGNDGGFFGGEASNRGVLFITLPPFEDQIDSYDDMLAKMRARYDQFPAANFDIQEQGFLGGGSPIDIVLRTNDLDKARELATEIKDLLDNEVEEVIEPQISLSDGLPIASIQIDRDKAYSLGLNIYTVANEISAAVDGKTAGRYRSGGDEIDILVILQEEDRSDIPDLDRIFVLSQTGNRIPVSSIAKIERTAGPVSISREDRSRVVHVTARQKPGVSLNMAETAVRAAIAENIVLDDNVVLEYAGDFADLLEYIGKFVLVMVVALALVYGIMASLFESLKDPFIIFLSIFMIVPGILLLYSFMNLPMFTLKTPLSMFSAVGLLMLVGIAVNNGIVLVDYMNLLRDRGMCIRDAAIEAGGNRLRPILMTSLTTVLGMVPLAFGSGEGAELVRPIGQTIVGGMVMSTLMTLFLVPMLYARMNRKYDERRIVAGSCEDSDDTVEALPEGSKA